MPGQNGGGFRKWRGKARGQFPRPGGGHGTVHGGEQGMPCLPPFAFQDFQGSARGGIHLQQPAPAHGAGGCQARQGARLGCPHIIQGHGRGGEFFGAETAKPIQG